jgi:hypothetical protein
VREELGKTASIYATWRVAESLSAIGPDSMAAVRTPSGRSFVAPTLRPQLPLRWALCLSTHMDMHGVWCLDGEFGRMKIEYVYSAQIHTRK